MHEFGRVFLVRHGSTTIYNGPLSAKGHEEAERAANEIEYELTYAGDELPSPAVMCSTARRCRQTADAIALRFGVAALRSKSLRRYGHWPERAGSLEAILGTAIRKAGLAPPLGALVVVTHEPLIAHFMQHDHVPNGGVYEYPPVPPVTDFGSENY